MCERALQTKVLSLNFLRLKPCLIHLCMPEPKAGAWRVSCLLGSLRSSASIQEVFCRSCSTCRCISDVFVGRKVISTSYSSAILKVSPYCWVLKVLCIFWITVLYQMCPLQIFSPSLWLLFSCSWQCLL